MPQHPLQRDAAGRLEQHDLVTPERRPQLRAQGRGVRRGEQPVAERLSVRLEGRRKVAHGGHERRAELRDLGRGGLMQFATLGPQLQHRAHDHGERPAPPPGEPVGELHRPAERRRVRVVRVVDHRETAQLEHRPPAGRQSHAGERRDRARGIGTPLPPHRERQHRVLDVMKPDDRQGDGVPAPATRAPSRSASFSCITPASEPNPSTCAYPTFVITAIVGSITSRRRGISPGTLAPASTTRASVSSGAPRIVSGTPTRLLRLPLVACTRYVVPSTARIISLALVLPLEPVTATTGLPAASSWRRARASRPSAASVSSTSKKGRPSIGRVPLRTTAAAAPFAFASARKSCASNRSPVRATNKVRGFSCRVSVETPEKVERSGAGTPRAPATASAVQTCEDRPTVRLSDRPPITTPPIPGRSPVRRTAVSRSPPPDMSHGPCLRAGWYRRAAPARARARSPCDDPLPVHGACPASQPPRRQGFSRDPPCAGCRTWRSRRRPAARTPHPSGRVCRGRGRRPRRTRRSAAPG